MDAQACILILLLGSPSFEAREQAQAALCEMGGFALPYVQAHQRHPDPEIACRCSRVEEAIGAQWLADLIASSTRMPWIDALPLDHPNRKDLISHYLARSRKLIILPIQNPWPNWRLATALYLRDLPATEAEDLLERMPRDQYYAWSGAEYRLVRPASCKQD